MPGQSSRVEPKDKYVNQQTVKSPEERLKNKGYNTLPSGFPTLEEREAGAGRDELQ